MLLFLVWEPDLESHLPETIRVSLFPLPLIHSDLEMWSDLMDSLNKYVLCTTVCQIRPVLHQSTKQTLAFVKLILIMMGETDNG